MKKVFLFLSIGIILLAIPLTVYFVGKNQEIRKRAAPASTISFNPSTHQVRQGQNFNLSVKLDTASNQVGLVQLAIVYDPAYLEAVDITNDTFAPTIRNSKKIDPAGKVTISVGARDTTHPIQGTGSIAILTMKAIKASATPLMVRFANSPETAANAFGEGSVDVLIGRSPSSITILNADGTPSTATIAPTSTLAANSTGTPSPTPRPSTSLTPTLTPSVTATPSPTTTPLDEDDSESSESALLITSIEEDQVIDTSTPEFSGTGIPGSTITIVINSANTITATVTVDEDGNWSYTPTSELEDGNHTVEVIYTDPDTGDQQTATTNFVVAAGAELAEESTGSAIPATGATETTIVVITLGMIFLLMGIFLPKYIH